MDFEKLKFIAVIVALIVLFLLLFSITRTILGFLFSRIATPTLVETMKPALKWLLFMPKWVVMDHMTLIKHLLSRRDDIFPSLSNEKDDQPRKS